MFSMQQKRNSILLFDANFDSSFQQEKEKAFLLR